MPFHPRSTARPLRCALAALVALAIVPGVGTGTATQRSHPHFGRASERITNPYLPVSHSHRCVLKGKDEGQPLKIVRTLQHGTRTFDYRGQKVESAVVKDRVFDTHNDELIERTLDYFAQDKSGGVHYFGERVSEYAHGQLTGHPGQWLVGRDTQRPGLLMPAHPKVGDHFRSESVPGITIETDRVIARQKSKRVRGRTYHHVIRVHEHATYPKPDEVEYKTYSRGTGVITEADNGVGLVGCT